MTTARETLVLLMVGCVGVSSQQVIKVMTGAQMRTLHAAMDLNGNASVSMEEASKFVQPFL
jgi:hypothetical protein